MKNTYQHSFKISLGENFLLCGLYTGVVRIPELLNLRKDELDSLIYSALVDIFSNYIIGSTDEEAVIIADWETFFETNKKFKYLSIEVKLNTNQILYREGTINYLSYYVEAYLYELFLLLNLSMPGSITLFQTVFKAGKQSRQINIDDYFFSNSLKWSNAIGWPKIGQVPIGDVVRWYKSLNIGIRQVARNNLERVIFSLLHVCNNDQISSNGLIWLAHSLESLFESPKSSISITIINRSFKVLGEPEENSRKIKKMFQEFYDLRSKYVHGELNIHHPSYNEILDDDIDEYFNKVEEAHKVGISIVIACMQLLILNNWKGFKFREEFEGI